MKSRSRSYLDHNASAPLLPAARDVLTEVLDMTGNPSSVHAEGRALREIVEQGREAVARAAGMRAERVVFTGSATEALTQAIAGAAAIGRIDRIVVSAGEHQAALRAAEAAQVPFESVPLLASGEIDLGALRRVIGAHAGERLLVAVHQVNNETGVVQSLGEIEAMLAATPHLLVVDAVQGFGRLATDFDASRADMTAVSGHKIGGPAGIGALIVKPGCDDIRLIPGGGQQQGRRGGTESAALSAAFGAAAEAAPRAFDLQRLATFSAAIEAAILERVPDGVIFGRDAERVGTTVNFAMPGLQSATALIGFDLAGVSLSAGSACSSGKVAKSHVLKAMRVPDALAECALRVSVGWSTTHDDVARFTAALETVLAHRPAAAGVAA
ncbi:MAG TPA: aminotransferase class V-fold PLP-dependent enzyme [Devosiaceae bacterium]|nr:aminotransferase class V-fold PLP-dependent enzyme [Devosiaceae bacterium]